VVSRKAVVIWFVEVSEQVAEENIWTKEGANNIIFIKVM
jgi:hypothetical protein